MGLTLERFFTIGFGRAGVDESGQAGEESIGPYASVEVLAYRRMAFACNQAMAFYTCLSIAPPFQGAGETIAKSFPVFNPMIDISMHI